MGVALLLSLILVSASKLGYGFLPRMRPSWARGVPTDHYQSRSTSRGGWGVIRRNFSRHSSGDFSRPMHTHPLESYRASSSAGMVSPSINSIPRHRGGITPAALTSKDAGRRGQLRLLRSELQSSRAMLAKLVQIVEQQGLNAMATHSGTWHIELVGEGEEQEQAVAYESPAFSLGGDFRFRLIATVEPMGNTGASRGFRRVGFYVRYIGRVAGPEDMVLGMDGTRRSNEHEDGQVTTIEEEVAIPVVRCSARRLDLPNASWVSSQPISFGDPTALEVGMEDFTRLRQEDDKKDDRRSPGGERGGRGKPAMVLRVGFRVDLLSVHFPGREESERLRQRSWEVLETAVEQALTDG